MNIEPLDISHQGLLETKLRKLNLLFSEYSFANLYLFRHIHKYELAIIDQEIFIGGKNREGHSFLMLTSHPSTIPPKTLKKAMQTFPLSEFFYPFPDNWINLLGAHQVSFNDGESDYLFNKDILTDYRGRHLDGPRNLVKRLFLQHEVKVEKMISNMANAVSILENWKRDQVKTEFDESMSTHSTKNIENNDYSSCLEAIKSLDDLHLEGIIAYADGSPVGFAIGERLNDSCYAVHFSKAAHSFKGVYQLLFQDVAKILAGNCMWINLEQDLGIPSLRYAKLSLHPNIIAKKWRVSICTQIT